MKQYYKILFFSVFVIGALLRLLLFWVNPTNNFFDDHYEPIFYIIRFGAIAPKDLFFQSYQPPVFYVISAMFGKLAFNLGASLPAVIKMLQFIPCFYGIVTLGFIYLILKRLPLSDYARLLVFGIICFLPAHIYISAIHSNDTITYLCLAICTYLMLLAYERGFPYTDIFLLSILITLTLFTKYTSYVVLPMAFAFIVPLVFRKVIVPKEKLAAICLLIVVIPLLFLCASFYQNIKKYNNPIPWNSAMLKPSVTQPKAANGVSFVSFKPYKTISTPILNPGNLDSFWTLIYSSMWFDVEPKFLFRIDRNYNYWNKYYAWIIGKSSFPSPVQLPRFTHFVGSALIALGLIPLLLVLIGSYIFIRRFFIRDELSRILKSGWLIFPVLLIFNIAGVIALTLLSPVFSSMKAIYFLNSFPTFALFTALGVMFFEKNKIASLIITITFCALFLLVFVHIFQIIWSSGLSPAFY